MNDVVLITIDSLRADHMGYHGYERETTPVMDEYARSGSRFKNAFAHVGGTRFSFPSILSGVTPLMYGGYGNISGKQTLISEVFSDAGYRTGAFHSNLFLSADFGYNRGWNEFFDSAPDKSTLSRVRRWAKTTLSESPVFPLFQWAYDFLESSSGINIGSFHVPADEITNRAIEFLQADDDPTFLWVHYMDVHHPFLPPKKYQLEYLDDPVRNRESIKLRRKFIEEPDAVTDEELRTFIDLYDAAIRFNDAEIGRLLDAVELHCGEDPLVALTADHGDHFLERGYFGGARAFDVKTHVPLFLTGWDDDGEYDELVGLADVPSTLVEAAGLDTPDSFEGYDLGRLVFDNDWPREEIVGGWGDTGDRHIVVRETEWKLIRRPDRSDELYHLPSDPQEENDVIANHPNQRRRLEQKIDRHLQLVESTQDPTVERPEMNKAAKQRLRRLGYRE